MKTRKNNIYNLLKSYQFFLNLSRPTKFPLDILYSDLEIAFSKFIGHLVTDDELIDLISSKVNETQKKDA